MSSMKNKHEKPRRGEEVGGGPLGPLLRGSSIVGDSEAPEKPLRGTDTDALVFDEVGLIDEDSETHEHEFRR